MPLAMDHNVFIICAITGLQHDDFCRGGLCDDQHPRYATRRGAVCLGVPWGTNAQLVMRAREIIERIGATVIGPEQARQNLGLIKKAPQ